MHQRGEYCREISCIGRKRRRRNGEARLSERRGTIGAHVVIETPIEHLPAQRMNIGKPTGVLQCSQCSLRSQQFDSERFALSLLIARVGRRAFAIEESGRAKPVMPGEHLFLELWLERKGGGSWDGKPDVDLVLLHESGFDRIAELGLALAVASLAESHRELDTHRPVCHALAGPKCRFHSAFGCQLAGERSRRGGLQQLQGAVKIGLADAIGSDEYGQPPDWKTDIA